jgi:putative sterol carrier protein
MVRYLSLEWIEALTATAAATPALGPLASAHPIGVTQVVTDGPEGEVVYHLQAGDGAVEFGPGAAFPEDVRMEQDWDTAVGVATGTVDAEQAFITGRIRLSGDQMKLIAAQPLFGALDAVFTAVRADTDYR